MIKLLVSDLDDTLLNKDHLTDSTILSGIEKINKKNRYFSIATGRSMHEHEMRRLGFENIYCVCMNGALIRDKEGRVLSSHPIDKKIIEEFINQFNNQDINFSGLDYTYSTISMEEKIAKFKITGFKDVTGSPLRIRDFFMDFRFLQNREELINIDIYKIDCRIQDEETQQKMEQFLKKYQDYIVNAPAYKGCYEITAKGINKAVGVLKLAEYLNLSKEEVAVFGDGGNDLEMLSTFENSYTPENGCEQAQKCAHHHIGNSADYSVINKMLELIQE